MKTPALIKHLSVLAFALVFAVGCATAPEPEEECLGISDEAQAAIDEARAVNSEARAMGADWRGARTLINQAEEAGAGCNNEEALQLAQEARQMAEDAIARHRAAMEEEVVEEEPAYRDYTVRRGDSLWAISGSRAGYNDPYQWPLIYRANTDQIEDADLIHPNQVLRIEVDPSSAAVEAAVRHARTRGEWQLGRVEASDRRYLSGN